MSFWPKGRGERRRREWSNLAIAGESKGEREQGRCRVVSSRPVSGRTVFVIGDEQAIWLAAVVGMRSDAAVDGVGNWRETSVSEDPK